MLRPEQQTVVIVCEAVTEGVPLAAQQWDSAPESITLYPLC